MTKRGEGSAELVVYFEPDVPDDVKVTFIRYVHDHIQRKATDMVRLRYYMCLHCHTPVENCKTALERLSRGLKDIVCVNCEQRVPLWDLIEEKFASPEFRQRVRVLEEQATARMDNESRELILIGHAFAIAGEAGGRFSAPPRNPTGASTAKSNSRTIDGKASGKRLYLQLKSGDSYLSPRQRDDAEIFTIKNRRHAEYWQQQAYPVMLVIRTWRWGYWLDERDGVSPEARTQAGEADRLQGRAVYCTGFTTAARPHVADTSTAKPRRSGRRTGLVRSLSPKKV